MELKKQFTFSGIFKKFHEEDSEPVEISVADIYCYTNGSILMEIASEVNQSINDKASLECLECAPKSKSEGKTIEGRVIPFFEGWMGILSPGYKGDYKIEGTTNEGWRINAITFKSDDSIDIGQENKCQVRLRDLCIDYDIEQLEEGETQEVVYGLANIEIGRNFSASVGNLDAEVYFDRVSIGTVDRNGVLSAEMTLRNIRENGQSHYDEAYCGWLIYLLSFASGCYVDQVYRIKTVRHNDLQIKREYWSGGELHDARVREIAVIQFPLLDVFIQQCAKKLTWETFSDKGLGSALGWYINTFANPQIEMNFLLLCTVLETLNKKHSMNASKGLLPTPIYKKIREEILTVISDFEQNIDNQDDLKKYKVFALKVSKSFASGSYNQIGNLRTSLKEMFKTYSVPHEDLFPELEFIKIRDVIVHEGFGGVDAPELRKLSNLVVRVFLAILEYRGECRAFRKIEIADIEIADKFGRSKRSKHELICLHFPLTPDA